MKYLTIGVLVIMFFSCTKKDNKLYAHYLDKNPCNVVGFNVEKQDTNDFYMIKTFDDAGILRHIKTQLYDIQYTTYQFDYDITYAKNKATFKGVTRQIDWMPSEIFDNGMPNFNPDAPFHPVENIYALERRNLEVVFDSKTGYAVEVRFVNDQQPLLTLAYDNKNSSNM